MRVRRLAPLLTVFALVGCGGNGDVDIEDVEVTRVPQSWLKETAEQWPSSDGFDAAMPVLEADGSCLTFEEGTTIAGAEPTTTGAGFGRLGFSSSDDDYLYVCSIWDRDHYAGDVQLIQVADLATAEAVAADLADEDRTAVVSLEVNSLDEEDFEAYTDRDVAEDLVAVLARG